MSNTVQQKDDGSPKKEIGTKVEGDWAGHVSAELLLEYGARG